MLTENIIFHPSISCCLSGTGSRWQQKRYVISPACSGSGPGLLDKGRRPNQAPKPPQLAPFGTKEQQLHSKLLPDVRGISFQMKTEMWLAFIFFKMCLLLLFSSICISFLGDRVTARDGHSFICKRDRKSLTLTAI